METQAINLFIVDDNQSMVSNLKQYLQSRFGNVLKISTFNDGKSCLKKVDDATDIVILDGYLNGESGLDVLKSIKEINDKTQVIMLSSNEDIAMAIDSFRMGAKDYVVKGSPGSMKRVGRLIGRILTGPIRIIVREFGVSKFVAIFLLTFVTMGIVVLCVLQAMKH